MLSGIRDTITVKTVLGEPVVTDDVTLVPVHRVVGMGCQCGCGCPGGKSCQTTQDDTSCCDADQRGGAGARVKSTPVGAFAIRGKEVAWHPVMDLNKVILGGQLVGVVALLVAGAVFRACRKQPTRPK
jgi:uncharacterized spore protein YtfJ